MFHIQWDSPGVSGNKAESDRAGPQADHSCLCLCIPGIYTHKHVETPQIHTVYTVITHTHTKTKFKIKTVFTLINRMHKKETLMVSYIMHVKQVFSTNSIIGGGILTVIYPQDISTWLTKILSSMCKSIILLCKYCWSLLLGPIFISSVDDNILKHVTKVKTWCFAHIKKKSELFCFLFLKVFWKSTHFIELSFHPSLGDQ